uniref:Uncharacterized protein n=1 Tax=Rhizophora mucronata TaxID=61149 RepID=A0A2P2P244_RHIMU
MVITCMVANHLMVSQTIVRNNLMFSQFFTMTSW